MLLTSLARSVSLKIIHNDANLAMNNEVPKPYTGQQNTKEQDYLLQAVRHGCLKSPSTQTILFILRLLTTFNTRGLEHREWNSEPK